MAFGKDEAREALRTIKDSGSGKDLVEIGAVKKVAACDGYIKLTIGAQASEQLRAALRSAVESAVRRAADSAGEAVQEVFVEFVMPDAEVAGGEKTASHDAEVAMKQAASSKTTSQGEARAGDSALPGVQHIIAVGAGKGGVGKSTISVNLAMALARKGHAVGVLDADIYGPSAPTLLGLHDIDTQVHQGMLQPFTAHGLKAMTIGKLVDPEKPLIWRGPMAHGAFKQLTEQTAWGELDYLIIDLPPGTGDVPLSMAQMLNLDGAVIVCTPQRVAQDDAVRAARMFQQLQVPILGVVENMSFFIGDDGKTYDIFGRGGAEQMAQRMGLPFLGAVPINMKLREHSDSGEPARNFGEAGEAIQSAFEALGERVEQEVALSGMRGGGAPTLTVS